MREDYSPEYSEEELLVYFKDSYDKKFVEEFGGTLGFEIEYDRNRPPEVYVFRNISGKLEDSKKRLESYSAFVDSVEFRDLKCESRWNNIETLIDSLRDLHDNVEISDKEYKEKMKDIQDRFEFR